MENGKCSFTGHRNIKASHIEKMPKMLERAIQYAYSEGCRTFCCGGAVGFDTYAARAVIKFRISHPDVRLVLILPCINQAMKWSAGQVSAYEYTLSVADEIVYIADEYMDGCIKERNLRLATEGDILISYVSNDKSGAAQTVRMATKNGKRVYNLYPAMEKESC